MSLFVLEIGTEELPARFLQSQEDALAARFAAGLAEAKLAYSTLTVMSTPRRAVVILDGVAGQQDSWEEVFNGPPVRAAWQQDGPPTKALEGFVRTHGVALTDVFGVYTEKGEYCAVRKIMGGASATDVLAALCPAIITALPFAKRMRWGAHSLAYARPLRWILALLDAHIVPFTVGPVTSDRVTYGHRVHSAGALSVPNADMYLPIIREQGHIEPDAARRRERIIQEGNSAVSCVGGAVQWNDALLDEVQGLCECPVPLLGSFDTAFLEIPDVVLLTSMQSHQKSFGVRASDNSLLPYFLTVSNTRAQNMDIVRAGWERVLRARLEDARFFWRGDVSIPLDEWLARLDKVIFLGLLGSMGDKTRRLEQLCAWLAKKLAEEPASMASVERTSHLSKADFVSYAGRAGRLSKADLVSGMVGEFDTLQGVMGGIYAAKAGEPQAVAVAIGEHYLPAGPDSPLPTSLLGIILSMADKADTLVGCFGLGMIPTGAADPNALRRCALSIIRCILGHGLRLDVRELFAEALRLYGDRTWKLLPAENLQKQEDFFTARLKQHFVDTFDSRLVDAVLNVNTLRSVQDNALDIEDAMQRLKALDDVRTESAYAEAMQTFKRVSNIVHKHGRTGNGLLNGVYDRALLQESAEKALAAVLDTSLPMFDKLLAEEKYSELLRAFATIRPAVDSFFDGVMVMCEDAPLRTNRLNMLHALAARFGKLADFAALPG